MHHYTRSQDFALLVLRLVLGAVFIWAGYAKWFIWAGVPEGMPMAEWMVYLTKFLSIVEPLGGAALILGFLTRWAAAGLAIIMAGSLYFVYSQYWNGFFTGMQGTGMDYNVLLLVGSVVLAAFGAGCWAVDRFWKK